jgi:hypothetical protein
MTRLKRYADEAGRKMSSLSTTLFGANPDAAYLEKCAAAGVDCALLALPPEGRDTILPLLDEHAALIK